MTALALNACVALVPVVLFLVALVAMDTFKLARWTSIVEAILWGVVVALLCDANARSVTGSDARRSHARGSSADYKTVKVVGCHMTVTICAVEVTAGSLTLISSPDPKGSLHAS